MLVGADIEGIYPSLDPQRTGETVRQETMKSDVKWKGVDWGEALKDLKIGMAPYKARQLEVEHLLPRRMFNKGHAPGITSENALSGDKSHEERWTQRVDPTKLNERDQAKVIGCCLEIAVVTLFSKHCYKFGRHVYRQVRGGPTGLSSTGSCADVRVTAWAAQLTEILEQNSIEVDELFAYVDDLRTILDALKKGTVFCPRCRTVYQDKEQETRDLASTETDSQRTARVLLQIFNCIESDLNFTIETQEDFEEGQLSTLDTKMKVVETEVDAGTDHEQPQEPTTAPQVHLGPPQFPPPPHP